jgi:hypothetical protein
MIPSFGFSPAGNRESSFKQHSWKATPTQLEGDSDRLHLVERDSTVSDHDIISENCANSRDGPTEERNADECVNGHECKLVLKVATDSKRARE